MPQSRRFFITAPGTNQGKTLVTAALLWQLRQQKQNVSACKPIICGGLEDTHILLQSLGLPVTEPEIARVSPWRFKEPLSPDEAARREGREIKLEDVVAFCRNIESEILLIEGAGGVMSPLHESATNLDLITALGYPTILVSACYLGCISPLLTALEVLRMRKVPVAGVVLSQAEAQELDTKTVLCSLRPHLSDELPVMCVNHLESSVEMWKTAPDLTRIVGA